MYVDHAHLVPTDLFTYRFKVVLRDSARVPITGHTTANTTIWRAGQGEVGPLTDISGTIAMVEVDAVNAPGLYELTLLQTDLDDSLRGSYALIFTNDGGTAFEDLTVIFLLMLQESFGGVL